MKGVRLQHIFTSYHMGIQEEFLKAYTDYADALLRHCFYRVFDRERAKDLAQETFLKTWEYLAGGHEVKNLRAFLYKVANNLVIDAARKKKEASLEMLEIQGYTPSHDPTEPLEAGIMGRSLQDLMVHLDHVSRQVLVMRYIDDMTPREIAEVLGVTADVVSVRIHRALQKLRSISHIVV